MEAIHARFKRAHERVREAVSQHFTTLVASRAERCPVTLAGIRDLRPGFRSVVFAVHLEGLNEDQAAVRVGVPLGTLRARLRSAYELLGYDEAPDFTHAREEYERERRA
jgi:DNA-directed RNA polymerase specialized sigma24 family protein